MPPPVPDREVERLRYLKLFDTLNTGSDQALQDLVQLAAAICAVPISAVSLIDKHEQRFKARVGLTVESTPRDIAFCAHTIIEPDLLVVEDASADPRFRENPLVTSDPQIRFYAGAPLTVITGVALGALCVIDRVPRRLTNDQAFALRTLSHAVVTQMRFREALDYLQAVERVLPVCAWCRSVRKSDGTWRPIYEYVAESVPVTHGVCPTCAKEIGEA
jgi:GAF domain-containing protein